MFGELWARRRLKEQKTDQVSHTTSLHNGPTAGRNHHRRRDPEAKGRGAELLASYPPCDSLSFSEPEGKDSKKAELANKDYQAEKPQPSQALLWL